MQHRCNKRNKKTTYTTPYGGLYEAKQKVIDSITVCGLCAMLTVTAVTNSGRSEVKAEDKVLANTGLEHTGYNSYAGVAATHYEKGLTAENAVTVEKRKC